jgi:predicted house-cleaning noncanonical NTP pyrophosphatase (MazG superfamily)
MPKRHIVPREDIGKRQDSVEPVPRSVVVHIRLTEEQRNTLKAALNLEEITMQEYFEAKAAEKIAALLARVQ